MVVSPGPGKQLGLRNGDQMQLLSVAGIDMHGSMDPDMLKFDSRSLKFPGCTLKLGFETRGLQFETLRVVL